MAALGVAESSSPIRCPTIKSSRRGHEARIQGKLFLALLTGGSRVMADGYMRSRISVSAVQPHARDPI